MRIERKDIVMEDDVIVDGRYISGYMCAYLKVCEIAKYNPEFDDDYINFYPTYDVDKDRFDIYCSGVQDEVHFDKKLFFTNAEKDLIFDVFVETYFGTIENFNDFVREVKG